MLIHNHLQISKQNNINPNPVPDSLKQPTHMETPFTVESPLMKTPPSSFLLANGTKKSHAQFNISDIEMVAFQSLTYTSLKDLLPASPPPIIMSPTYNRRDSWREIPIRDPLVKHAAWAYLQPMSSAPEADGRSCFSKLKDKCCGESGGLFGCFGGFFNDVVLVRIRELFWEGDTENEEEDDDEKVD